MFKKIRAKYLYLFFAPLLINSCIKDKKKANTYKLPYVEPTCEQEVFTLYKLLNGDFQNQHNTVFLKTFANAIQQRNLSPQNKKSIDDCLSKYFLRANEINQKIGIDSVWSSIDTKTDIDANKNYIEHLCEISETINCHENSKFFVLANSKGTEEDFNKLGYAFESKGLQYALILKNFNNLQIFFTNDGSNIFIDSNIDKGNNNRLGLEDFLEKVKEEQYDQCIIVPILALNIKEGNNFVHLGGYLGEGHFGLSMLLSLFYAKVIENVESRDYSNIYLFKNDEKIDKKTTVNMVEHLPFYKKDTLKDNLDFYQDFINLDSQNFSYFLEEQDGMLIEIDNSHYIVVAQHILKDLKKDYLAIDKEESRDFISLVYPSLTRKTTNIYDDIDNDVVIQIAKRHKQGLEKKINLEKEINVLEHEIKTIQTEIGKLYKNISDLNDQLQKLDSKLDTQHKKEEIERKLNDLEQKLKNSEVTLNDYYSQLSGKNRIKEEKEEELMNLFIIDLRPNGYKLNVEYLCLENENKTGKIATDDGFFSLTYRTKKKDNKASFFLDKDGLVECKSSNS